MLCRRLPANWKTVILNAFGSQNKKNITDYYTIATTTIVLLYTGWEECVVLVTNNTIRSCWSSSYLGLCTILTRRWCAAHHGLISEFVHHLHKDIPDSSDIINTNQHKDIASQKAIILLIYTTSSNHTQQAYKFIIDLYTCWSSFTEKPPLLKTGNSPWSRSRGNSEETLFNNIAEIGVESDRILCDTKTIASWTSVEN